MSAIDAVYLLVAVGECLLLVSTKYTNVTDGQTDRQTPRDGIDRAYA